MEPEPKRSPGVSKRRKEPPGKQRQNVMQTSLLEVYLGVGVGRLKNGADCREGMCSVLHPLNKRKTEALMGREASERGICREE